MSDKNALEERLLRFAAPALYKQMIETFSNFNIHPYDIHGTVMKDEEGLEVTLRFSNAYSQSVTTRVSFDQANAPDEEMISFFKETAEKCKSQLISDYYKMIKL